MKITERIQHALQNHDMEVDSIDKIIAIAYMIGREQAAKEISDKYNDLIAQQNKRAENCRYHKMASEIIGEQKYIYSPWYDQTITNEFGNDNTNI